MSRAKIQTRRMAAAAIHGIDRPDQQHSFLPALGAV
jgi:hypothetical protein